MISFEDAYRTVLQHKSDFGVEKIALAQGIGRILRENWYADRDMPPYDRVTMDGIAINFNGLQINEAEQILIEGVAAAGDPIKILKDNRNCLEVMTGSILPVGTDTIIRYEDIAIENKTIKINAEYKFGQNIHKRGKDRKKGDQLIHSGTQLSASEIGVGASIGIHLILVSKWPKTLIVSTGNELVDIHENPLPHQIRKSNVYRIAATLNAQGVSVETAHLDDDYHQIIEFLEDALKSYEVIILSGGVSMGKFDYLPRALTELNVNKHFHKVAQRPGKPFWFGTHPSGCTVFAMPGNPVSSFMCTQVYLLDWLQASLGHRPVDRRRVVLSNDITFNKDLTYFMECKTQSDEKANLVAQPMRGNGSGDLANLLNGNAFVKFPCGKDVFKKGEIFEYWPYR